MYKVYNKSFSSFKEVEDWAWNEYRIPPHPINSPDEDLKHQICLELESMISTFEEDLSDYYYGG